MSNVNTVYMNSNGGYYEHGSSFTQSKWRSVLQVYYAILEKNGKCTVRTLAKEAGVSNDSAHRIIKLQKSGMHSMPVSKRGHGKRGIGTMKQLNIEHHTYIYELYKTNPSMPLSGYCEEFYNRFGIQVSDVFIKRWFDTIGRLKGSLRVTSSHNISRYNDANLVRLQTYLSTISNIQDHARLVFSDEKPMKEVMIFPKVRRDPFSGESPKNKSTSTSKNRYNILAAVNIKGGQVPPVYFRVLEATTNAAIYCQFVKELLDAGVLRSGDFFIVDNCSIHTQGDNIGLADALWNLHGITLLTLPPYSPEFNPTEFVFNTLKQRLTSERARYKALDAANFLEAIINKMHNFDLLDIVMFYKSQGYIN